MKSPILHSSLKSFFTSLFATIGVGFGLLAIFSLFAGLATLSENTLETENNFTPSIAPNSMNVRKELSEDSPVILKINIAGVIGADGLNMQSIRRLLVESREGVLKNNRVKAILLQIATPGGTAIDSDGIYRALLDYKKQYNVPVWGYVDGGCLSGGMYIASACDKLYASDVSLIGSVGTVTGPFFNVSQTLSLIGIESKTLTAGAGKDPMNPFRPWKENESEELEAVMQSLYNHFVDIVAKSRPKLNVPDLKNQIGAKFFPADKALELGLVDHVGNSLNEVIALLAKEIGQDPEKVQIVEMEKRLWISEYLRGQTPLFIKDLDINTLLKPNLLKLMQ